mmetsp:Transcript_6919/g.16838  ORF Transcript_6919/g.16838 Transcript_6919/m.16838 type:complete len:283 (-) Transcript_6919:764-1612(-)
MCLTLVLASRLSFRCCVYARPGLHARPGREQRAFGRCAKCPHPVRALQHVGVQGGTFARARRRLPDLLLRGSAQFLFLSPDHRGREQPPPRQLLVLLEIQTALHLARETERNGVRPWRPPALFSSNVVCSCAGLQRNPDRSQCSRYSCLLATVEQLRVERGGERVFHQAVTSVRHPEGQARPHRLRPLFHRFPEEPFPQHRGNQPALQKQQAPVRHVSRQAPKLALQLRRRDVLRPPQRLIVAHQHHRGVVLKRKEGGNAPRREQIRNLLLAQLRKRPAAAA